MSAEGYASGCWKLLRSSTALSGWRSRNVGVSGGGPCSDASGRWNEALRISFGWVWVVEVSSRGGSTRVGLLRVRYAVPEYVVGKVLGSMAKLKKASEINTPCQHMIA